MNNYYDLPKSEWSRTVRLRMAYANRRGVPTGPAPLGYLKVRRHGQTFVEPDPLAAPMVREAFLLAEMGGLSVRDIVTVLDAAGVVSRRGVPLSAMALWRVLTNPFYCGTIRYAGEEVEGIHETLVTRAEFDRVQEILASRRGSKSKSA